MQGIYKKLKDFFYHQWALIYPLISADSMAFQYASVAITIHKMWSFEWSIPHHPQFGCEFRHCTVTSYPDSWMAMVMKKSSSFFSCKGSHCSWPHLSRPVRVFSTSSLSSHLGLMCRAIVSSALCRSIWNLRLQTASLLIESVSSDKTMEDNLQHDDL